MRGWWPTFGLGLLIGLLVAVALRPPPRLHAAWAFARTGAWPGPGGLVLTLRPAPPALAGEGGPWLALELWNTGPRELEAWLGRPPGDELELLVDGQPLPVDPAQPTRATPLVHCPLAPGARLVQLLDVSARAPQLAPGLHRVAVHRRRLPALDELEATSNEVGVLIAAR